MMHKVRKARLAATFLLAPLFLAGCFQVQLYGPVSDSAVAVTRLNDTTEIASGTAWSEAFVVAAQSQQKWDGYGPQQQLWLLGIFAPNTSAWDDEGYYLLTATGGLDTDVDLDQRNDKTPTPVTGQWHSIISGADAKRRGAKVSALTEAVYQYLLQDVENLSPVDLRSQLDLIARRLVSDVNNDDAVNYLDALQWSRLFDTEKLLADIGLLDSLSSAIVAGETDVTAIARAFIESGADYDGEWVYRFSRPDGNSFTCAHCHAVVEPAQNGFSRPGHHLGDATARADYKDGQLTNLIDAANSCLDEWMNASTWTDNSGDWMALESWLNSIAPPTPAASVDIQIVDVPSDLRGGDARQGRDSFNSSCAICHGQDGSGSRQAPAVAGFGLAAEYIASRVRHSGRFDSAVYEGLTGGIMPFWGANRLSDQDLLDMVAYLELGQDEIDAISGDVTPIDDGGCGADHPMVGYTAQLVTRQHRVSGTATIVDDCTIEVTGFNYDGRGIVVQAYTGNDTNFFGEGAFAISPNLVGTAYANATVQFTLPESRSLDEFNAFSIWCVEVGTSFGDGIFEP